MNYRSFLFRLILFLVTLFTAMQFTRYAPQLTLLTRISTTRLANLSPFSRSNFSTSPSTFFSPSPFSNNEDKTPTHEDDHPKLQGLPAPPTAEENNKKNGQIDITSNQGIRFDHLGPIVVNKDGTMSRITNWDKMAAIEKENTLRILGKRNKARMEALKKKEQEQEQEQGEEGEKEGGKMGS